MSDAPRDWDVPPETVRARIEAEWRDVEAEINLIRAAKVDRSWDAYASRWPEMARGERWVSYKP